MFNTQSFESGHKSECGPMGRRGFGKPWKGKFGGFWGRQIGGFQQPAANIEENEASYVISLFAAGLNKEKFALSVKDDVLTISYQGNDPSATPDQTAPGRYTYQEHTNNSFERSFRLNDKVITDTISASYADGILTVTLPKNPLTNKPAQTISVG